MRMKLSREQIAKAMKSGTVEALMEEAKASGQELSREEAEAYLAQFQVHELSADDLKMLSGGGTPFCPIFCPSVLNCIEDF